MKTSSHWKIMHFDPLGEDVLNAFYNFSSLLKA